MGSVSTRNLTIYRLYYEEPENLSLEALARGSNLLVGTPTLLQVGESYLRVSEA